VIENLQLHQSYEYEDAPKSYPKEYESNSWIFIALGSVGHMDL
jgi:hypothetical protein